MINAMKLVVFVLGWMIPLICFALPEKNISTDDLLQGPVALDGLWAFDWKKLHTDGDLPMRDGLLLPGLWHKQGPYTPQGFATLRLKLNMPMYQPYYLRVPDAPSAISLWVNGQLRFKRGVVGHDALTEVPLFGPDVVRLEADSNYDLILHVSNFHHKEGGVWHNLLISDYAHRNELRDQSKLLDAIVFSFLILMSIYVLIKNISKNGHASHVFFALFVWAVALRSVMVGERIVYDFIGGISWESWQRIEHILLFFALPMFVYFFHLFFNIKNMIFPHLVAILSFILSVATLLLPSVVFTEFNLVAQVMGGITVLYMLIILSLLIKQKKPLSVLFTMSFLGWALLVIHDYLYTHLYIQSRPLAQFGLVFFVVFQMYLLWQYSKKESRLLLYVKSSIDRNAGYLQEKYKSTSNHEFFLLKDWLTSIELYCDVLGFPIYIEDGTVSVRGEPDKLQDVVLILVRMAESDGILASLHISRDQQNLKFEFILNKVIHNQEMLYDELNLVHHLLNDMNTRLHIERLSSTTTISFNLPFMHVSDQSDHFKERSTVEYFGNDLAEPILFVSDQYELIISSLSEYFYLIKASITKENIDKYRPKLLIWQVESWDGYTLEDIKRIRLDYPSIPIILLVDDYYKVQLSQCIRMGITDYVISPVMSEELLLKVQRLHHSKNIEMPNQKDVREVTVQLIRSCIAMWQKYSGKGKVELAESSRLWRVYMDGSTAKTRTLDKYLSLQTLPKNPRWETVSRTAQYVLEQCQLDEKDQQELIKQITLFNQLQAVS